MLRRYLPVFDWGRDYDRVALGRDLIAALIVTVLLIPQSLAYAMLAGLPAEVGLYASMAPLLLYTLFGTSRTLSVGPVAVTSLMTAAAVGSLAVVGTPEYLAAAIALAFIAGALLVLMGLLRLGFLANFLSHPVISGFITASALIIAASQLGPLLGVPAGGHHLLELLRSLVQEIGQANGPTAAVGVAVIAFLFWSRRGLRPLLRRIGLRPGAAAMLAKTGPILAVVASIIAVRALELEAAGVAVVGSVPAGLPSVALPPVDGALWRQLLVPALLIAVVGYVETVSVAQTLAAKRRQRIDPDQELIAMGAANLGASVSGGLPVTGGFSRSVVNFDAGAQTPAAGAYTAVGIGLVTLYLTPWLHDLPKATLAATIVVAVLSLVDLGMLRRTWRYSRADFSAMLATILATLVAGVEVGILAGVGLSIALYLYRTSRPHVAVVGRLPGTEHFRNVERHAVETDPGIVSLRVDESLYFSNARFLEDTVNAVVARSPEARHLVLMCSAVNFIDASALESLEAINARLAEAGVQLHLSEVKGPVMDRLERSDLLRDLSGQVFISQYEAVMALAVDRETS